MNRTLTREQIEEYRREIKAVLITESFEEDADGLDLICNMALNSIPKAFDPEDEATWPENGGLYLVWRGSVLAGEACFERCYPWDGGISHYMPIPEVGESK